MENPDASSFSAEAVERAVLGFYANPTDSRLNAFLTKAKSSRDAWNFCWQLAGPDRSPEVQYYGANVLHAKISKNWNELATGCDGDRLRLLSSSLRDGLFRLAEIHRCSARPVAVKVDLCLASYVLVASADVWPGALREIVRAVSDSGLEACQRLSLLRVLSLVPEEFGDVCLDDRERSAVERELEGAAGSVFELVRRLLSDCDIPEPVKIQALDCLSNWLRLEKCAAKLGDDDESSATATATATLSLLLFDLLRSRGCFSGSVEALTLLLEWRPSREALPEAGFVYLRRVVELRQLLDRAGEQRDLEAAQSLVKVVLLAATGGVDLIFSCLAREGEQADAALDLLRLVAETLVPGLRYPTEENWSDLSFGFLHEVHESLVERAHHRWATATAKEFLLGCLETLLGKIRHPAEEVYSRWKDEEREAFQSYRQDFAEAAAHFESNALEGACANLFCCLLEAEAEASGTERACLQTLESLVFAVNCVVDAEDEKCYEYISRVFRILLRLGLLSPLPSYPDETANTASLLPTALVEQLVTFVGDSARTANDETFVQSVHFLLECLGRPEVRSTVSEKLESLLQAEESSRRLPLMTEKVLAAVKSALERDDSTARDCERLARCLGRVLSTVTENRAPLLAGEVLLPHMNVLLGHAEPCNFSEDLLLKKLALLIGFCSSLGDSQENPEVVGAIGRIVVFRFATEFLARVERFVVVCSGSEEVTDRLFSLLAWLAKTPGSDPEALVPRLCEVACSSFDHARMRRCLGLVESLLALVSSSSSSSPSSPSTSFSARNQTTLLEHLSSAFFRLCSSSWNLLFLSGGEQLPRAKRAKFAEVFMDFLSVASARLPSLFSIDAVEGTQRLVGAAVKILDAGDRPARTACKFLTSFVLGAEEPCLQLTFELQGRRLIESTVRAIAQVLQWHDLCFAGELLVAAFRRRFEFAETVLVELLEGGSGVEDHAGPLALAGPEDRRRFLSKVLRCSRGGDSFEAKRAVGEFSMICRGQLESLDRSEEPSSDMECV